ncbi:hypothetical protein GCM10009865_50640 [Aeromicrobium ponti]|uniref:Uncharacterized protein n=1 Tax=Cytobacillus oceanisediminis TaxID=665099 RepID=A0A562J8N3_9BACI|nr:hypothetical protein [Cytobacillus oceanisediminis]TWH79254.1 hypothetical protein IQ19_05001 [Cytobacillus oceanisediminis]
MKKWFAILFMVSFFLAAGAFYYEGAPEKVAADEEQVKETDQQQEMDSTDSSQENSEQPVTEVTTDSDNNSETAEESEAGQINSETEQSQKTPASNEKKEIKDTIEIDGTVYVLIMDESKYPNITHLIEAARKYNAKLYGIQNSDVFAVVKDGKAISHFSVGGMSVLPEHAEFAKIKLSEYKGIAHNIDLVNETKAKVTVEWSSSAFYSVEYKDGWIVIYYN